MEMLRIHSRVKNAERLNARATENIGPYARHAFATKRDKRGMI